MNPLHPTTGVGSGEPRIIPDCR